MKASRFALLVAVLLLLRPADSDAQAALFWDTNPGANGAQGGTGNWLGTNNWNTIFSNTSWIDGTNAVFGATPGTVTVNGAVTANQLAFNVDGYIINGTSRLTLGGATPTIFVNNAGQSATVSAPIGGSAGLTKAGDGTLILGGGFSTYTGPTTINAGRIMANGGITSSSAVVIANVAGATLDVADDTAIGSLAGGGTTGGSVTSASGASLSVGFDNTSTTFAGIINAAGVLTKTGTGTLTLTNNSNTCFNISISAGALSVPFLSSISGDPLGSAPLIRLIGTLIFTGGGGSNDADFVCEGGGINVANAAGSLTMSGSFTGTGGFIKSGPGTLFRNDSSSYAGATNITGGTLWALAVDSIPSTSMVTLADVAGAELRAGGQTIGGLAGGGPSGGNVVLSASGLTVGANDASTTFAGTISGNGGLTKIGTGTLTLTGANSYSGSTVINVGTLRAGGGNAIPNTTDVTVSALGAATLDLNGNSATIRTLSGGGLVTLGSGTLTVGATNASSSFPGGISGSGGLTKVGTGVLTLTGTNTYTGPTAINAGTLLLAGGNSLSDLTAVTLANVASTVLDLNNSSETIGSLSGGGATGGDVTLGNGTLTIGPNDTSTTYGGIISGAGGSIVKVGTGTLTFTFIHTFTGDLTIRQGAISVSAVTNTGTNGLLGAGNTIVLGSSGTTGTLLFTSTGADSTNRALVLNGGGGVIDVRDANGALTLSGSAGGSGGLTKLGPGTLLLSGNNSYSGPTLVAAGKLQASGGNAIGDSSALTLSNVIDGALELLGVNETVASLAGGGASGGNVALGSGFLTVGGDDTSTTYAGAISGSGGLTKNGNGTMTLSGTNSFTGPTTINAGTLRTVGGSALADTSPLTVAAGAVLDLNDASEAIGSLTGNGDVTLGSGALTVGANNSSTTYAGAVSGSGGLIKTGTGTFTLTGANNYTGPTDVAAGTLALESGLGTPGGALNVSASGALQARNVVNRAITGAGTITATGTLFLGDPNSVSGVAFGGTLVVGSNVVFLADGDAAELGAATTLGAGGRLDSLNGAVLGSGESATVGAAVSASISGNFTNNGTVNGPTSAGQALTFTDDVNGTGSYTGRVTFSDGFSPGASAAAVSLENFTFDSSTTLNIELGGLSAGAQFDQLNFTGTGLLDGTLIVSLIDGFNPQPGNAFSFIQGGVLSGAFDAVNLPPLGPGLSWSYSQTANAAMLAVVPEPALASFFAAGALAMALVRRPRAA